MLDRWNERLKNHPGVTAAFLVLATVITYAGALRNTFVYDDDSQILSNPFILNPHFWTKIFTGSVWSFNSANSASGFDNFYRPLQIFYYWLVYRVAGPNPGVFHFLQVLIYAVTGWFVYRLGCEIFEHQCAALLGAGLWILHPLHVEAVAWISGLPEVGCGFFFLLAFLLFVRAEKSERPGIPSHLVAALVYFPALFFKEMALSFPLLTITYWFFLSPPSSFSTLRDWTRRIFCWMPYAVAVGAYLAVRISVLGSFSKTRSLWNISSRTLESAMALLGQHARLFVWPIGLSVFRTFHLSPSFRSPWPWIALLTMAVAIWLRKRDAQMSFLVAWWGITLLPCLDIRQLSAPQVADRFSYIPSVGPCLAVSLALLVRLPVRTPGRQLIRIAAPALALLMVFWATLTVLNIPHWRNNTVFMEFGLAQSPDDPALHNLHGYYLRFVKGDVDGAEREYRTALSLNQKATVISLQVEYDSYFGLAGVAQVRGRNEQALALYKRAADISPQSSTAYVALGAFYFPRRDFVTASRYFVRAVHVNPQDVLAHMYLGGCWIKLGKFKQAAEEFHAVRTVDPTLKPAYLEESRALEASGDHDAAAKVRQEYSTELAADPEN